MAEIDRILRETITDPVGPEFMACRHAASPREARPALTWSREIGARADPNVEGAGTYKPSSSN
jgi:hypothetical protein